MPPSSGPAGAAAPAGDPFTERTPRVAAARRLTRRPARDAEHAFLAEGPQAVREALASAVHGRPAVRDLFGTDDALARHPELVEQARAHRVRVSRVTPRAAATLSETATPQGLVAVCAFVDVPVEAALAGPAVGGGTRAGPAAGRATGPGARFVAVLADVRDPGNAGTVLRSADAAGAGAVLFAGDSVDPYNGKAVRASAGSLFHLPVVRGVGLDTALAAARRAGLAVLAATADGEQDLDDLVDRGALAGPTAWVFGNEAAGLPPGAAARADARVRVPMHGRAESLNLAAAAAICLYASARANRITPGADPVARAIP